jgi:hypothetical protein
MYWEVAGENRSVETFSSFPPNLFRYRSIHCSFRRSRPPKNRALAEAEEARARYVLAAYQRILQTSFREVSDALINVEQLAAVQTDLDASAS